MIYDLGGFLYLSKLWDYEKNVFLNGTNTCVHGIARTFPLISVGLSCQGNEYDMEKVAHVDVMSLRRVFLHFFPRW